MIYGCDEYSKKWYNSSMQLFDEGLYEWAAKPFEEYEKVLEIGCGTGYMDTEKIERDNISKKCHQW